jgi:hypothetical protein
MTDLSKADWRTSSYSSSNGGNCVEVARNLPGAVAVRDSKDPEGGALVVTPAAWQALVAGLRAGRLA